MTGNRAKLNENDLGKKATADEQAEWAFD